MKISRLEKEFLFEMTEKIGCSYPPPPKGVKAGITFVMPPDCPPPLRGHLLPLPVRRYAGWELIWLLAQNGVSVFTDAAAKLKAMSTRESNERRSGLTSSSLAASPVEED